VACALAQKACREGFSFWRADNKLGEDVRNSLVHVFSDQSAQVVENEDSELKVATAHPPSKCRYLPRDYSTQGLRSRDRS
jgi:hypothetical protein